MRGGQFFLYVRLGAYSILCLPAVIALTMSLIFFSDGTYSGYVLDWIIIAFALATIVAMVVSGVRFKKSICNNSVNVYTRMKRFYLLVWTCFAVLLGKMILVMKNEKKRRGRNGTIKRANDFYK